MVFWDPRLRIRHRWTGIHLIAAAAVWEDTAGLKSKIFPRQAISRRTRCFRRPQIWAIRTRQCCQKPWATVTTSAQRSCKTATCSAQSTVRKRTYYVSAYAIAESTWCCQGRPLLCFHLISVFTEPGILARIWFHIFKQSVLNFTQSPSQ